MRRVGMVDDAPVVVAYDRLLAAIGGRAAEIGDRPVVTYPRPRRIPRRAVAAASRPASGSSRGMRPAPAACPEPAARPRPSGGLRRYGAGEPPNSARWAFRLVAKSEVGSSAMTVCHSLMAFAVSCGWAA